MADELSVQEYKRLVSDIAKLVDPPKSGNYYPIFSTPLELHAGVTVTGTFETDDDTTEGRLSYVTVRRDSESLDPSNGYGFAWMKGDGSMYNVYLVDNSTLANDLFVTSNFVVNPQGENAWKAAARVTILPSTDVVFNEYNFELIIGIDYSMSLKIWKVGDSKPGSPTATCGAPINGPSAIGSNFGYGVMGTKNSRWWYDNLLIQTSSGIHTAVLFKYKARPADFPNNTRVRIKNYGYGHDGVPASGNWGLTGFIRKKVGGNWTWVQVGTNTAQDSTDKTLTKIEYEFPIDGDYRDTDETVSFLATSTYAASQVTEVSTYYTALETAIASGVHTGGCADIYINDPSRILVAENTLNNLNGNIELSVANGFLGPIHSIVRVETSMSGDPLAINTDWSLVSSSPAYAYSTLEYPYISFNPALTNYKMHIVYRYYQDGTAVQTLLDSADNRYSGVSNLAKVMPPVLVNINTLDYRGNVPVETVRSTIRNYVNAATDTVSLSDMLNYLYTLGVAWIDMTTIDVEIVAYDYTRTISEAEPLTTTYTIEGFAAFYADDTSLAGIRRV